MVLPQTRPPAYPGTASISRSQTSAAEVQSAADTMLQQALARKASSTAASSSPLVTPRGHHYLGVLNALRGPYASASSSSTTLPANDSKAELRLLGLQQDLRLARAQSSPNSTPELFKKVCSTDILFLLDTTCSMKDHIGAAKNQVKDIVRDVKATFLGEADVRIAVVAYTDHSSGRAVQLLDFTTSTDEVHSFLDGLTVLHGKDFPEDVLGGIQQSLNASWKQQTRCIIHIGDAPPHGNENHDFADADSDDYYVEGSEPHGLTYRPLLKQMVALNINYALLRITKHTDRMVLNFSEVYAAAAADCTLHKSNRYYKQVRSSTVGQRAETRTGTIFQSSAVGGLVFLELQLGTSYASLQCLVLKVVTTSVSRTALQVSSMLGAKRGPSKLCSNLLSIEENESASADVVLEDVKPHWDTDGWFDVTLKAEGFCPNVGTHGASTLDDMMAHDDNIKIGTMDLTVRKRSRPFGQGTIRSAHYARTASSTNRFVVKSYKRSGKTLAHFAEDMQIQALCKAFALEFNSLSKEHHPIDFIVTTCLRDKTNGGTASDDDCMSLEPFIDGNYVKYNTNGGWVNNKDPDDRANQAAQAFSHFTFERSQGRFLVSDLQGSGYILTDPAVHALDPKRFKLTDTNLGKTGFKLFFVSHECNSICRTLGLKSDRSMASSGKYEFRKKWPKMQNTVCCSNKLCGKIVRVSKAKKSKKYPGQHWCDGCWPQLSATTVHRMCDATNVYHRFEVSEFYCESQGQTVPDSCPGHSEVAEKKAKISSEDSCSEIRSEYNKSEPYSEASSSKSQTVVRQGRFRSWLRALFKGKS